MDSPLRKAGETYLAALAEEADAKAALAEARARRVAAREAVDAARTPLAREIVAAAKAGKRQKDILEEIRNAYTRETIRRICQAARIEPAE
jgi:hypothetical protein